MSYYRVTARGACALSCDVSSVSSTRTLCGMNTSELKSVGWSCPEQRFQELVR
jgi:hypothetical protein